uniref:hypothetical protein n=1 Tax=Photorhabdus viridis TaxID=3163327 RepID=UPI00330799AE
FVPGYIGYGSWFLTRLRQKPSVHEPNERSKVSSPDVYLKSEVFGSGIGSVADYSIEGTIKKREKMMKKNKKVFDIRLLIYLVCGLIVTGVLICMLGIPLGIILAFIKTGNITIELNSIIDFAKYAVKVGGGIGFVLGLGLWLFGVIEAIVKNNGQ